MRTRRWKAIGTLVAFLTIAAAAVGAQPESGSDGPRQRDPIVDTPGYVGPAFDGQIPDIHEDDGFVVTVNGVDVYDHQEGSRDWNRVREAMQDAGLLDTDQTGGPSVAFMGDGGPDYSCNTWTQRPKVNTSSASSKVRQTCHGDDVRSHRFAASLRRWLVWPFWTFVDNDSDSGDEGETITGLLSRNCDTNDNTRWQAVAVRTVRFYGYPDQDRNIASGKVTGPCDV